MGLVNIVQWRQHICDWQRSGVGVWDCRSERALRHAKKLPDVYTPCAGRGHCNMLSATKWSGLWIATCQNERWPADFSITAKIKTVNDGKWKSFTTAVQFLQNRCYAARSTLISFPATRLAHSTCSFSSSGAVKSSLQQLPPRPITDKRKLIDRGILKPTGFSR